MKRFFPLLLACALLMNCFSILAAAEATTGLVFDKESKYSLDAPLAASPCTFEAYVCFEGNGDGSTTASTIFGNYTDSSTSSVNFDVQYNGNVRYTLIDEDLMEHNVYFGTKLLEKEFAKVTLTHDAANGKVLCYVDGELIGSKSLSGVDLCSVLDSFVVGGDNRTSNPQYFRGTMQYLAVYSDVLSAEEVKADVTERDTDNLLLYYDVSDNTAQYIEELTDLSPNKNNATCVLTWFTTEEVEIDYEYSFVVVGDTQIVTEYYPEQLSCIYNWIVANKESKNIQFVFGLGDITNRSTDAEWAVAKEQIAKLDGVVPYSLVRGNHDKTAGYDAAFLGGAYDTAVQANGGKYSEDSLENTYQLLTIGEDNYLILCLDFGPTDEELAWADGLCEKYADHQVIVTTHSYLYRDGTTHDANDTHPATNWSSDSNNGDDIWEEFVKKHENIVLVLSGHTATDYVVTIKTNGDHGNTVTQMLIDPQGMDARENFGPTGMITLLYFSKDGKCVEVETYSTIKEAFHRPENQYVMTWNEIIGDVDMDYSVDLKDVLLALKAKITDEDLNKADMNGDAKITLIDVLKILKLTAN